MKRKTLAILLLPLLFSACLGADEVESMVKSIGDPGEKQEKEQSPILNGVVTQKKKNGNTTVEIEYKDGRKNGMSREYYEDGTLWKESEYRDNLLDGVARVYDREGRLEREVHYRGGYKHGELNRFFKSGKLKSRVVYERGWPLLGGAQWDYQGNEVPNPVIEVEHINQLRENNTYGLEFSLNPPTKKMVFYVLERDADWQPRMDMARYQVPADNRFSFTLEPGYEISKKLIIYAAYNSKYGDPMITRGEVNLRIRNN